MISPTLGTKMMQQTKVLLLCLLTGSMLLGCVTPIKPGVVVQPPVLKLPPVPQLVEATQPKPVGYFQQSLVDYSLGSPAKLIPSTPPTSPVALTPTK